MSDPNPNLLKNLVRLGKIDSSIAKTKAEIKNLENKVRTHVAQLKKLESELLLKKKVVEEKKFRYQKEDHVVRDERAKLVDRRKALTTLSSFKLQQAAEKEVEHASRTLDGKEEVVLAMLDELEALEKDAASASENLDKSLEEYKSLEEEAKALFAQFEERIIRHEVDRQEVVAEVDPVVLKNYEKIRERHPMDPLSAMKNNGCAVCFMAVGPQVLVSLSRGDSLVRCPGCGRGLYLEDKVEG